jgi:hypothetical protein
MRCNKQALFSVPRKLLRRARGFRICHSLPLEVVQKLLSLRRVANRFTNFQLGIDHRVGFREVKRTSVICEDAVLKDVAPKDVASVVSIVQFLPNMDETIAEIQGVEIADGSAFTCRSSRQAAIVGLEGIH